MRTLQRATLLLLTLVFVQTTVLAEGPTWRDSTRDVYVDGHLDRAARVLSADAGKKTAVLLPGERQTLLLDREASTFSVVPRKAFAFAPDGPELARGTYLYSDASGKRGEERWTLFAREDGGRLVRSRIDTGDLVVEVFQGTDAAGKLKFAEITKRQGEAVERARFFVEGNHLTGRLRGKEAGILQQDLVLPPQFAFAAPAIAASGWMGVAAASGATAQLVCYVAPSGFESPLGTTCVFTHRVSGEEAVKTAAGEFKTTHLARQSGAQASDWWIHPDLGIPVRGEVVGGLEYELTRLEIAPKG